MKKVFIINGAHAFGHSQGKFNNTLTEASETHFKKTGYDTQITYINRSYNPIEEAKKFVWADLIVYHTPIWWFQLPFGFKKYIDVVLNEGQHIGIYKDDGRSRENPAINYGTGGSLKNKKYILTTSWNAPKEAFEWEGEFFEQTSVDKGVMFGFHKMNKFIGLQPMGTIHFHDIEKNADVPKELIRYEKFLNKTMQLETV